MGYIKELDNDKEIELETDRFPPAKFNRHI